MDDPICVTVNMEQNNILKIQAQKKWIEIKIKGAWANL